MSGPDITPSHRRLLGDLRALAARGLHLTLPVEDPRCGIYVGLVARGLVSFRNSSIGEPDEKSHLSITDAGRDALCGGRACSCETSALCVCKCHWGRP